MMKPSGGDKGLPKLIESVYDAALDEALWDGIALTIAQCFDSRSTTVHSFNLSNGEVQAVDQTKNITANMEVYRAYYWRHDVWAHGAAKAGLSQVFTGRDLITEKELVRTEFYNDFARKCDQFHIVGSVFAVTQDERGVFGIHRPRDGRPFTQEDKRRVGTFLPHLQRALQLRHRLAGPTLERHATLDALDRTGTATLVVARDGRILYANGLAQNLMRSSEGIRAMGGRLVAGDRGAGARLAFAIQGAVDAAAGNGNSTGGAPAIPRADRLPLTLLIAPFRPARDRLGAPIPAAIVFVRDPEHLKPSSIALQDLFGLTPAEASIAGSLAEGKSVEDIAVANHISLNTVRTHLKSILAKTGTARQAQLVALLLQSAAVMRQP